MQAKGDGARWQPFALQSEVWRVGKEKGKGTGYGEPQTTAKDYNGLAARRTPTPTCPLEDSCRGQRWLTSSVPNLG